MSADGRLPTGAARTAGVVGWPITHSLSPVIMRLWIDAAGLDAIYAPFSLAPEQAGPGLALLPKLGLSGVNVTLPHKQAALAIADTASASARAIGAANVLTFTGGRIHADNTDAAGFLLSLAEAGHDPAGSPALVIGAGGAARAIVHALKEAGCPELRIANRTLEKAKTLAADLAPGAAVFGLDQIDKAIDGAGLIVNASAAGLGPEAGLTPEWRRAALGALATDIVYSPLETDFLKSAGASGLRRLDGLAMLIGQARPSFEAFFGCPAPDLDVRPALIERLEGRP